MREVASPLLRVMCGSFLDLRASRSSTFRSRTETVAEGDMMMVNFFACLGSLRLFRIWAWRNGPLYAIMNDMMCY